ncbi:low molecular weight heat shock protein [Bdellovibrio bacteriovorus str. Tiberius]|uniref:Low molecular weight heat shock protein n=2 Tax=Bdellovibrio bacteriovorus TaxID=959 RepID=K7YTF2_BDEBC|nr:low molecular weight heat shock protein [Bdellovibrio bacteriovorus str. Tiberius]
MNSNFFEEMDRIFESFAATPDQEKREQLFTPACEVAESAEHYLLSMDVPGFKKEGIKIEVNGKLLTISGERKRDEKVLSTFTRSFTVPDTVDGSKVEAHHEDGVLSIYLPKAPIAKAQKIEIQTQKGGFFEKLNATQGTGTEGN